MKKIFLCIGFLIIFICSTKAQSKPNWNWVRTGKPLPIQMTDANVRATTLDKFRNIITTGWFASDTFIFEHDTLIGYQKNKLAAPYGYDIFLVKHDSIGNVKWAKVIKGKNDNYGTDVVTDFLGDIYITGLFSSDTIWFDSTYLTKSNYSNSTYNNQNIFIAKYSVSGNLIFA